MDDRAMSGMEALAKPGRVYRGDMGDDARDVFARIAAGLGRDHVYAWGSRARGWWADDSDYDVIIYVDSVQEACAARLAAERVGVELGVKVDLFTLTRNIKIYPDAVHITAQEAQP